MMSPNVSTSCSSHGTNLTLCFQGSYWTMDGPSDVTEVRAPKRPYPKDDEDEDAEEEEEEDVCF